MTILEHNDWKKAMRTTHPIIDSHGTVVPETPLRMLVKTYPDLAEEVFNKCVVKSQCQGNMDPLHPHENTLFMNYEFIDDAFCINAHEKEDKNILFKYCTVSDKEEYDTFKNPYNSNGKVVMDNHPLMIMAQEEQRVIESMPNRCFCLIAAVHRIYCDILCAWLW